MSSQRHSISVLFRKFEFPVEGVRKRACVPCRVRAKHSAEGAEFLFRFEKCHRGRRRRAAHSSSLPEAALLSGTLRGIFSEKERIALRVNACRAVTLPSVGDSLSRLARAELRGESPEAPNPRLPISLEVQRPSKVRAPPWNPQTGSVKSRARLLLLGGKQTLLAEALCLLGDVWFCWECRSAFGGNEDPLPRLKDSASVHAAAHCSQLASLRMGRTLPSPA